MISRYLLLLASAIILSLSYATAAKAQMLYVTFDGNGAPGEYYAKDTCLAKVVKNTADGYPCIQYVEGHDGQAIQFGQYSALAVPLDIDPQSHPQLTITAWVKRDNTGANGYIAGTGNNKGIPYLLLRNGQLTAMAGDQWRVNVDGIKHLPIDEWTFVAGVWDHDAGTLRLRSGSSEGKIDFGQPETVYEQKLWRHRDTSLRRTVFIGAQDFSGFGWPTKTLQIDDVRIYGTALSDDELDALASGVNVVAGAQLAETQDNGIPEGAACTISDECVTGTYCAYDDTCHPDNHRPNESSVSSESTPFNVSQLPSNMGGASALDDSVGNFPTILTDQYFVGEWCLIDMTATNSPVFSEGNYLFSDNGTLAVMPADVSAWAGVNFGALGSGLGWSWSSVTEHLRMFENDESIDDGKLQVATPDVFAWGTTTAYVFVRGLCQQ
jgi:hypothetical protein